MSLVRFNSIRSLAFLTWSLAAQTISLYSSLSLLPPSVGFLFVLEFVEELLVHPCNQSWVPLSRWACAKQLTSVICGLFFRSPYSWENCVSGEVFLACLVLESIRIWSPSPSGHGSLHHKIGLSSEALAFLTGGLQVLDMSTAAFKLGWS